MDIDIQEPQISSGENRIFERISARIPAKIKDSRDDYGQKLYLSDVSAQGAQMMSKSRFYVNDSLAVDLSMPGSNPLTLRGSVVWTQKKGEDRWDLGVRFHKVSLMHVSRLYERVVGPDEE